MPHNKYITMQKYYLEFLENRLYVLFLRLKDNFYEKFTKSTVF